MAFKKSFFFFARHMWFLIIRYVIIIWIDGLQRKKFAFCIKLRFNHLCKCVIFQNIASFKLLKFSILLNFDVIHIFKLVLKHLVIDIISNNKLGIGFQKFYVANQICFFFAFEFQRIFKFTSFIKKYICLCYWLFPSFHSLSTFSILLHTTYRILSPHTTVHT